MATLENMLVFLHAYRRMLPMKVKAFTDLGVDDLREQVMSAIAGKAPRSQQTVAG